MDRALFRVGIAVSACVLLFAVFSSSTPAVSAQAENWWDTDWDYRVTITVTGSVGNDNVISFVLDNTDNLGGFIGYDNFQDLRFFEGTDNGPLPYWIERTKTTYVAGDNATIYLRRPTTPDSTIMCYFGNDSAAPKENGDNVFLLWDNFDGTTIDAAKWVESDHANNYITQNEVLNISGGPTAWQNGIFSTDNYQRPFTYEFDWRVGALGYSTHGVKDNSLNPTYTNFNYGMSSNVAGDHDFYYNGAFAGDASPYNALIDYTWRYNVYDIGCKIFRTRDDNEVDMALQFNEVRDSLGKRKVGFGLYNQAFQADNVRVRSMEENAPTVSAGAPEAQSGLRTIAVSTPTVDNTLVDRDWDNMILTTPILATRISVQATVSGDNDNAWVFTDNVNLWVRDNLGATVVDNVHPTDNSFIDENTIQWNFAAYNPIDATTDAECGGFSVYVEITDNEANYDNWGYGITFTVSDLASAVPSQQILPGHQHRIYEQASRAGGGPVTLTGAWILDNNDGLRAAAISGADYENTYYPTDNGQATAFFETAELDGEPIAPISLVYSYPNLAADIHGVISIDNTLIDNHASDNAITTVLITVAYEDNDGFDDFLDNFWLGIRDYTNTFIENRDVTASAIYENENRVVVSMIYDAEDNNFTTAELGEFDVHLFCQDNWSRYDVVYGTIFTVTDLDFPINFTPPNPYAGWDLTVSGTGSREFGAATIDSVFIIDANEGTFDQGAGNAYSENYNLVNAGFSETVSVTIIGYDGILDGENSASYTTSSDQKFEIFIRFEENYELVDWIPDVVRPVELEFSWDGGSYPYLLTSNPENIIFTVSDPVEIIQVTDNDLYWRRNVLDVAGGEVVMIIQGDNLGTVGGTSFGEMDDFTFFLQDFTGLYEPPDGIMSFRIWIGENLAIVTEDFWGAEWKMIAWLITGSRYQVWMESENGPLRLIGPIDAVNSSEEKTIQVTPFVSEVLEIYAQVYWAAYRVSDNVIRVEYQDNISGTISAYVAIDDYSGTLLQAYQPDNDWFVITYSLASPNEGYNVDLSVTHSTYGIIEISVPISYELPEGGGISGNPFNLPDGVTLAALGSFIIIMVTGLAFDSTRLPMGMLGMATMAIFCWLMGWLPLPGPFDGAFTATMFMVAAVIVVLAWRSRR